MKVLATSYLFVASVCFGLWSGPSLGESDRFIVPEDDLPEAMVNGHRVAFTRNGAFAVSKDGRWLFDGGLSYATPGRVEWGTQVRRSGTRDRWQLEGKDKRVLLTFA